ncbi:MAG: type II secretion system protein, partial [Candidatus Paceibacterota bacterium]
MVRFITHNFFFIFSPLFQKKPRNQSTSSFTLIELLIVIGILAILTAAVVIVLNPTELLKQGRDSTRMT